MSKLKGTTLLGSKRSNYQIDHIYLVNYAEIEVYLFQTKIWYINDASNKFEYLRLESKFYNLWKNKFEGQNFI